MAQEKLIFAKPSIDGYCFIIVFNKEEEVYVEDVFFAENAKNLNQLISENITDVRQIRYDVSIFIQEGKDLRELIPDTDIFLYKPKQKLDIRIAAHTEWLQENLITDYEYDKPDYIRFVNLFKEFHEGESGQNAIAVDILSDVAKYYRRNLLYR